MKQSESTATSSFILSNYRHLMNGNNELIEKMGTEDLMIPSFSEDVLMNLCESAIAILKQKNRTLLQISSPSIVIGDLHGNLHDLIRIINSMIDIFSNNILFLGDYVDRGHFQLETITLLLALRIEYPNNIFLIRGNHEFINVNSHGGFKDELLESGYSESLFDKFNEVFCWLPISAIINEHIFCVHGGLSPFFHGINQLETEFKLPIHDIYTNNQSQPQKKHRLSDVSDKHFVSQIEKVSLLKFSPNIASNSGQLVGHHTHRSSDAEEKKNAILNIRSSLDSKSPPLPSKPFPIFRKSSAYSSIKDTPTKRFPTVIPKSPLPNLCSVPPPSQNSMGPQNNSDNSNAPILPYVSNPSITVEPITPNASTPILPAASNPFIKVPISRQNSPYRPIPSMSNCSALCCPISPHQSTGFFEKDDDYNNIQLLTDIMWSDPTNSCELFLPSNRGSGCYFGFVVTNYFLKRNNMKMIVRGHQIIKNGVETTHEKKVITVYSSSSIKQGGYAACIIFSKDDNYKAFRFRPITTVNRGNAKFFAPTLKPAHIIESHTLSSFNLSPSKFMNLKGMRKNTKGFLIQQSLDQSQDNSNNNDFQ